MIRTPRLSKDPQTRKREIIAAAQILFIEKGFAETRISDIARKLGVSQGVFYYYFATKEDVIAEIVSGYMSELVSESERAIAGLEAPLARLAVMAEVQRDLNSRVNAQIHAIKGVDIHERIIQALVLDYIPLMQRALDGDCANPDTRYWLEIMVVAGNVLFDPGLFIWPSEGHLARVEYLISLMERTRNLPAGSLGFYGALMLAPDIGAGRARARRPTSPT
jgi:AcrR family transcriptional regulator